MIPRSRAILIRKILCRKPKFHVLENRNHKTIRHMVIKINLCYKRFLNWIKIFFLLFDWMKNSFLSNFSTVKRICFNSQANKRTENNFSQKFRNCKYSCTELFSLEKLLWKSGHGITTLFCSSREIKEI